VTMVFFSILLFIVTKGYPQKVELSIGSGTHGTGPYLWATVMSQVANEFLTKSHISSQVTPGYAANMALVGTDKLSLAHCSPDNANDAYHGVGRWKDKPYPKIRALFNTIPMMLHVVVPAKSNFIKFEDLKGKRVNVGSPGTATENLCKQVLNAHGWTVKDVVPNKYTTGEVPGAIKDGNLDAGMVYSQIPLAALQDTALTFPIRLIPLEKKIQDLVGKQTEGLQNESIIPAGSYKGIDKDVPTVGYLVTCVANADIPEDVIYEYTKVTWEHLNDLARAHVAGKTMQLKNAMTGIRIPLHPGAEKYFKEIKLIKGLRGSEWVKLYLLDHTS